MSDKNNKYAKFDKEAWIKKKKEERDKVFGMLDEATGELNNSDSFMNYLDVQSRFDKFSVSNAILVAHQKPEATRLEDSKTWKDCGAFIQKGEKAISIIERGKEFTRDDGTTGAYYNPVKVFDISQTDKEPEYEHEKKYNDKYLVKFLIKDSPVPVKLTTSLPEDRDITYDSDQKTILVKPGTDGKEMFRKITEAIAFVNTENEFPGRDVNGIIASAISYSECRHFGIEPYKIPESNRLFENKDNKEIRSALNKAKYEAGRMNSSIEKSIAAVLRDREVR